MSDAGTSLARFDRKKRNHFRGLITRIAWGLIMMTVFSIAVTAADDHLRYIDHNPAAPFRQGGVVVGDHGLVHTGQFSSASTDASLADQVHSVLGQLSEQLAAAGSSIEHIVRLHVCVNSESNAAAVRTLLTDRFPRDRQPALTIVVSPAADPAVLVSMDAVAAQVTQESSGQANAANNSATGVTGDSAAMVLPPGRRIFIAGQAEQSESLAEATIKTMDSFERTLQFLGRSRSDFVQLKCFTMPIGEAALVEQTIRKWFGDQTCPPIVQVEWKSSATTPIEIEAVAWGGPASSEQPWIEFLTPPGMTTSPIYSRVVRTRSTSLIYTDGFLASANAATDRNTVEAADYEVNSAFESLTSVMTHGTSDLKHLVKATYYVSTDAASLGLNRLRPNYYDPQRPPSASKAVVAGVGEPQLGLLLDMIAVPVEPPTQ